MPPELWRHTLSYLDYFSLRKLYRVSKFFHPFLNDPSLDEVMFRGMRHKTSQEESTQQSPRLHPFLCRLGDFITYDLPDPEHISTLLLRPSKTCMAMIEKTSSDPNDKRTWRFSDTSLPKEFAILPPQKAFEMTIYTEQDLEIGSRHESPSGIFTIEEFMLSMLNIMCNGDSGKFWRRDSYRHIRPKFDSWKFNNRGMFDAIELCTMYSRGYTIDPELMCSSA